MGTSMNSCKLCKILALNNNDDEKIPLYIKIWNEKHEKEEK